ncbi:MAG: hypothetical protein EPN79_02135 [Burkholderiaceae bacterium]|nr:MAG: hypothetical protein EPN79_02135 [Burkholderiaceae bacterium]TBR76164.1 MAG: hypothetical protein EPN64_09140 [Burkholderiaceae bacterium]
MSELPWRSLLVLALLAGMYFVCVFWGSYKSRFGAPSHDTAAKKTSGNAGSRHEGLDAPELQAHSGNEFSAALAEAVAPWVHIPPVGPLRQRFESDVIRLLERFEPSALFAIGEHGHYANAEVDAAWNGWKLALIALSMQDQLTGDELVSRSSTSFVPK